MTVSMEMVVPGLVGYAIDRLIGTVFLLSLLGFALGMTLAIWHLLRMTREDHENNSQRRDADSGKRKP